MCAESGTLEIKDQGLPARGHSRERTRAWQLKWQMNLWAEYVASHVLPLYLAPLDHSPRTLGLHRESILLPLLARKGGICFQRFWIFLVTCQCGYLLSFNDHHKPIFRQHWLVLSSMPRDLQRCLHPPPSSQPLTLLRLLSSNSLFAEAGLQLLPAFPARWYCSHVPP